MKNLYDEKTPYRIYRTESFEMLLKKNNPLNPLDDFTFCRTFIGDKGLFASCSLEDQDNDH
ncbi:hypothetical protein [Bartonella sp. B1099]|uniref:hypothetical protein n=1 Tax=Bartonella sp. B1099 TaxID=2911422 RepID=UPI0020C26FF6|nr:hypothetical protein [Bartonella sp. B1099]